MGQKVNPIVFRICTGSKRTWTGSWFVKNRDLRVNNTIEDIKIYDFFHKNSSKYSIGKIFIERNLGKTPKITIFSSKVSVVLGKKGENVNKLESDLAKLVNTKFVLDVREIKRPNLDADIVARSIADKITSRQSFKRASKFAIENVMKSGALGVKIKCSGRLNGAEIARDETFNQGIVPLHTLRADVDYACHEALTTYGIIGVKVWICIAS